MYIYHSDLDKDQMNDESLKRLAEAMLQIFFPSAFQYKIVTKPKSRYLLACYLPNDFKINLTHLLKVKKLDDGPSIEPKPGRF